MADVVTPAALRELAQQAEELAAAIDAAHAALHAAADRPTRGVGFRLSDAAGRARGIVRAVEATASNLARLRSRPAHTCPTEWGCCPHHGNTLISSGGRTWCTAAGCGRRWGYDRLGEPCTEPAAYEVCGIGNEPDQWGRLCAGHTISARHDIEGIKVRPLSTDRNGEP